MTKEETKQLVENIFGKEASEDDDIVDFYFKVNSAAIVDYSKQESIEFVRWVTDKGYARNDNPVFEVYETLNPDDEVLNTEQLYLLFTQSKTS